MFVGIRATPSPILRFFCGTFGNRSVSINKPAARFIIITRKLHDFEEKLLQRRNLIAFHWKKTLIRLCFCLQKTAIPGACYIGNAWHFFVLKCYLRLFTILKQAKKVYGVMIFDK